MRQVDKKRGVSPLRERAHDLLLYNTQTAQKDGRTYTFTVPSMTHYPFQWFWDSCFHAVVWTHFDVERAKEELRALLAWQKDDGFIPHIIFWDQAKFRRAPWHWHYWESAGTWTFLPWVPKPATSAEMQPAVLAQAVERIFQKSNDQRFLFEVLPKVAKYYRWVGQTRDPRNEGLISSIASFESGLDYSPAYDPAMGVRHFAPPNIFFRFRKPTVVNKLGFQYDTTRIFHNSTHTIKDVLVNSIYIQGLQALDRLACAHPGYCDNVSRETFAPYTNIALANWARFKAHWIQKVLIAQCYDEDAGLFWNLAGPKNTACKVKTVISLMPIILPGLPKDIVTRLVQQIVSLHEFWGSWPISSVARIEPSFAPSNRVRGKEFIWRGATSMNINWFLVHALRKHGYHATADAVSNRSRELILRHGFNEFYNPLTGEPVGVPDFSWTTLILDMPAAPLTCILNPTHA